MAAKRSKYITEEQKDGITVYSSGPWCGFGQLFGYIIVFLLVAFIACFPVYIRLELLKPVGDIFESRWLNILITYGLGFLVDMSIVGVFGFVTLYMPYHLIYVLSPKKFWLEDNVLVQKVRLLGFIPKYRRVDFDRIHDIKVSPSGSCFNLSICYEPRLPKLMYAILVYWSDKFVQCRVTLVNDIPSKDNAERLQNMLLEAVTEYH